VEVKTISSMDVEKARLGSHEQWHEEHRLDALSGVLENLDGEYLTS
jgi:hypothetical protein